MGRNCEENRHRSLNLPGVGLGLALLGCLVLGSCASTDPFQRVESKNSKFFTSLGVPEAACLIAEVLAYELPATQSNPSLPRALVWRYSPQDFEIRYDRGNGSFLPSSNGFLHRLRGGIVQGRSIPKNFLGPIRFVEAPKVSGPRAAQETIRVRVSKAGPNTLVQLSTSLNLLHQKGLPLKRLRTLLRFVVSMQGICDGAATQKAAGLTKLMQRALAQIGPGFSALQDDLLGRAQLIRGNLLMREDRRNAAWLAYQSARFFSPGRGLSEKLRGRLLLSNARPEEARLRVARSRLLAGPSSLKGRLLALEQERILRDVRILQDVKVPLLRGKTALLKGDWKTAEAFAQRSLNIAPGNTGALRLLSTAQEVSGALGTALSTQLRVVASEGESPVLVQRLAELLQKSGRPHLALGRLLRIAQKHPNVLGTDLAQRVSASISSLDQLRQVRATGKGVAKALKIQRPSYGTMLLLASPLGSLVRHGPRQEAGSVDEDSQPYEIDLGPGIQPTQPASPGK